MWTENGDDGAALAGRHLAWGLDRTLFARACGLVTLDAWQFDLLASEERRILLNVHRQGGKSTLAGILGLHEAIFNAPSLILVLAPALRQSAELIRTVKEMHGRLDGAPELRMESVTRLEFSNGSRCIALPGSEATVRGYSAPRMVVIDEAARVTDDLIAATMPMLATVPDGRIIALSTPAGRRGWFYDQWTTGEGWHRIEVPATLCPRISPDFLEQQRKELGPSFDQEYLNRFIDTGEQLLPSILLEMAVSKDVPALRLIS